jgi:hypothetical protein
MINDYLIDDLLRLQSRYATLIWRLKEHEGVEIEFFLEELAIDCAAALRQADISIQHLPDRPRAVHLPSHLLNTIPPAKIIQALDLFLQAHRSTYFNFKEEQTP